MTKRNYKENKCHVTTVRFTEDESKEINEASKLRGKSVSSLLKEGYFGNPPLELVIAREDFDNLYRKELRPMLNNLKQITEAYRKNYTYGFGHVTEQKLNEIIERFCYVYNVLVKGHIELIKPWRI